MQLYYHPYACSLAVAITASEAGIPLELAFVDIMGTPHTLVDGSDYAGFNPRNYVPLLVLDDGRQLSEVGAILQYLADLRPEAGLAAAPGSFERVRLSEWLTFVGTELHKSYSPWLFHPDEVGEQAMAYAREGIAARYAFIERKLAGQDWLLGDAFSVADAYLFVMVNWAGVAATPLDAFPNIRAWFERMKARPHVREALRRHSAMPKVQAA